MSKHTPGPWIAKHASDGCGDIGIVAGKGIVAECFRDIRAANEKANDECLANACLIAAAPDLLEALQMAKHIVDAEGANEQRNMVFAALMKAGIEP